MKRHLLTWLPLVFLLTTAAACPDKSPATQLLASCQTYQGLERQVILLDVQGKLTADQVATYKGLMPVARGICKKPEPGDPPINLQTALAKLDEAVLQMTILKGGAQ